MNKYQDSIDSSCNGGSSGVNCCFDDDLRESVHSDNESQEQEWKQSAFFSHFIDHSKILVNAFKEWSDRLEFITFEYIDGKFQLYYRDLDEPQIPYMDFMKKHLAIAYKEQYTDPLIIQERRMAICKEIEIKIASPSDSTPRSPTFETTISNRIKSNCPRLEATENTDPDSDTTNFYLNRFVFQIIFDVLNKRRQLNLKVKQTFLNNIHELNQGGGSTVARGDEQSMTELKSVLEELVSNDQIRSFVAEYNEIKKKLDDDKDITRLRAFVENLRDIIYGGKLLGGFRSCDLCIPGELSEVEIKD